ncbi:MAG: hypothetical protein ACR2PY_00955 [Salinispira sp.]
MPWKLLFILIIIAGLIVLIGFNWTNTSNVSIFGVYTFVNVPIIIIMGISFLLGAVFSIPYVMINIRKIRKKQTVSEENRIDDSRPENKQKKQIRKNTRKNTGASPPAL